MLSKNIIIASDSILCGYLTYKIDAEIFKILFPHEGQDIQFWSCLQKIFSPDYLDELEHLIKKGRTCKIDCSGIHGVIFLGKERDIECFPNFKNSDLEPFNRPYRNDNCPGAYFDDHGDKMSNILIIDDGSINLDIYAMPKKDYEVFFGKKGENIQFIENLFVGDIPLTPEITRILSSLWKRGVKRGKVEGIDGVLYYQNYEKNPLYPSKFEEKDMDNCYDLDFLKIMGPGLYY